MTTAHAPTVHLSAFIETHRDAILDEWVAFARTLTPWSTGLDEAQLRDHARELLSAIAVDIRAPQSEHEQTQKSKGRDESASPLSGVGKAHAIDRLEGGLKLDQLVSEYRALRASVLRLWAKAGLAIDNGEVIRFNEAIDETLAESSSWYAKKLDAMGAQFIAMLGHDLRNPLSSMVLGAELLTTSEALPQRDLAVAARILASGRRMTRMVSDMLDLTRTRLGSGIPVTLAPMDLAAVCQQICDELEVIHPGRRLQLECSGELNGVWDADRLAQVMSNLVGNALQHGAESEPVRVTVRGGDADVVIEVENAGEPIDPGHLRRIFEPMVHEARQGDRNRRGLGLGLFIAREIVTSHGGTVGVTSSSTATTFTVRLPRAAPAKL